MTLSAYQWKNLFKSVDEKTCTPFIGAGCSAAWLPLSSDIANKWAELHGYPFKDSSNLAKVAEFLALKENDMLPKATLADEIKDVAPPDFALEEYRNKPYAVLADLNLPVYITTNYDHFMEAALKAKGKDPVSEFCRWNNFAKGAGIPSVLDKKNNIKSGNFKLKYRPTSQPYKPTSWQPLVYHLHGIYEIPQSMVLTEADYIDFIVNLNSQSDVLPELIRQKLASSSLLFIGYSLLDINFRIIFRGIMNFIGSQYLSPNIAVMRPPDFDHNNVRDVAQKYLEQYTKLVFKVDMYWGDASKFSEDLREGWNAFKSQQ